MANSTFKLCALSIGGVIAFAHIGALGHLIRSKGPQYPVINFPAGDYSSYKVEAGKEGYSIEYRANDPAILESQKSLSLDKTKRGLFGGGISKADMERLIAAAAQTAPAQTIRVEQAPIKIVTDSDQPPYKM